MEKDQFLGVLAVFLTYFLAVVEVRTFHSNPLYKAVYHNDNFSRDFLKITKWECKTGRSWEDFLFLRERDCVIFQGQSYYTLFRIFLYLTFFVLSFRIQQFWACIFFYVTNCQLLIIYPSFNAVTPIKRFCQNTKLNTL